MKEGQRKFPYFRQGSLSGKWYKDVKQAYSWMEKQPKSPELLDLTKKQSLVNWVDKQEAKPAA